MNFAQFFTVPSQTTFGKVYTVRRLPSGELRCNCPAFIFRNNCKHQREINKKLGN